MDHNYESINGLTCRLLALHLHLDHVEAGVGRGRGRRRARQAGGRSGDGSVIGRLQLGLPQPTTKVE